MLNDHTQLAFQIRQGTSGAWSAAPITWSQMSSDPKDPSYLGYFTFGSGNLDLAPHSQQVFQVRAAWSPRRCAPRARAARWRSPALP